MKKNDVYFKNLDYLGDLNIDYIIFDYEYPVLFTCLDNKNNLYLCVCCDIRNEQRWIITTINEDTLINMLSDKITIRDAFVIEKFDHYLVKYYGPNKPEECIKVFVSDIPTEDLPMEEEVIEADEGEFDQYIEVLRKRKLIFKYILSLDANENFATEQKKIKKYNNCFNSLYTTNVIKTCITNFEKKLQYKQKKVEENYIPNTNIKNYIGQKKYEIAIIS